MARGRGRPPKPREYDEEKDFLLSEKIDHVRIIFRMIDSINKAAFSGNDFSFFRGIDTLESNVPEEWEDDKYKKEIKNIKEESTNRELLVGGMASEDVKGMILYEHAQKKFRAICNLFERRGLFGEREIMEII